MNESKAKLVVPENKASDSQPSTTSGIACLREAADRVLKRDGVEIAEALSKNSKNGQIQSAKFLYELCERSEKADEGESSCKVRSLALELANAPQWTGGWPQEKQNEDDEVATDS